MTPPAPILSYVEDLLRSIIGEEIGRHLGSPAPAAPPAPAEPAFEWVTNKRAMGLTGLSRSQLQRLRKSGALDYRKVGKLVYYRVEDLASFIERGSST